MLPPLASGDESVPSQLDHILLGCSDLQHGIEFVQQQIGARAKFGGVHPGRGTQNALLSLGERRYLEIIAPDPAQPDSTAALAQRLKKLPEPRLVGWAAHPGSLGSLAKKLRESGVAFDGPTPGSRKRPDGRELHWQTLTLHDDAGGLLPFFIEWSADSLHPSVDAPSGCQLLRFEAVSPDPRKLASRFSAMGLDIPIAEGRIDQLRATLAGSKGQLTIST